MTEIELKARLDDPGPVKDRLSSLGRYVRSYRKADTYWLGTGSSGVRVRRESGVTADGTDYRSALVTLKDKSISGSIEVNDEREFGVSDADAFEQMLCQLGLAEVMRKEKRGWEWEVPAEASGGRALKAEVSEVGRLGWFVEIEITADDAGHQTVEQCRRELLALLQKLEVPQESIETRSYAELLR